MSPALFCRPRHIRLTCAVLQKRGELEASTVDAVRKALGSSAASGGDVLVFLPGVAEIRRTQRLLQEEGFIRSAGVAVQQLHGGLAPQQQDEVIRYIAGSIDGQRRPRWAALTVGC